MYQTRRPERVRVNALRTWTVLESKSGRLKELKRWVETGSTGEPGRSQGTAEKANTGRSLGRFKFQRDETARS